MDEDSSLPAISVMATCDQTFEYYGDTYTIHHGELFLLISKHDSWWFVTRQAEATIQDGGTLIQDGDQAFYVPSEYLVELSGDDGFSDDCTDEDVDDVDWEEENESHDYVNHRQSKRCSRKSVNGTLISVALKTQDGHETKDPVKLLQTFHQAEEPMTVADIPVENSVKTVSSSVQKDDDEAKTNILAGKNQEISEVTKRKPGLKKSNSVAETILRFNSPRKMDETVRQRRTATVFPDLSNRKTIIREFMENKSGNTRSATSDEKNDAGKLLKIKPPVFPRKSQENRSSIIMIENPKTDVSEKHQKEENLMIPFIDDKRDKLTDFDLDSEFKSLSDVDLKKKLREMDRTELVDLIYEYVKKQSELLKDEESTSKSPAKDSAKGLTSFKVLSGTLPSAMNLVNSASKEKILWQDIKPIQECGILEQMSEAQKSLQQLKFQLLLKQAEFAPRIALIETFFKTLKKYIILGVVTTDEFLDITQDLPFAELKKACNSFLQDLDQCWQQDFMLNGLFDIIINHATKHFNAYKLYLKNIDQTANKIRKLSLRQDSFSELLNIIIRREGFPQQNGLEVYLLGTPVSRILEIKINLEDILSKASDVNGESSRCEAALAAITQVINEGNPRLLSTLANEFSQKTTETSSQPPSSKAAESAPTADDAAILKELDAQVDFPETIVKKPIVVSGRRLLDRCNVTYSGRSCHLILFSDWFLVTESISDKSKRYKAIDYCGKDSTSAIAVLSKSLTISMQKSPVMKKSITVEFESEAKCEAWLMMLKPRE